MKPYKRFINIQSLHYDGLTRPDIKKRRKQYAPYRKVRDAKDAVIIAGKFEQLQHLEAPQHYAGYR